MHAKLSPLAFHTASSGVRELGNEAKSSSIAGRDSERYCRLFCQFVSLLLYFIGDGSFSIHRSLDSNDRVEVEAAIFATSCLCQHSCTFAAGVCEKIASMVQGEG